MSIPKGWLDYAPIGKQIRGTRFICFKVPLSLDEQQLGDIPEIDQFTPDQLVKHVRNLGLIIDLTDTSKYYSPLVFLKHGIEYRKIQIEGQILPQQYQHDEFANIVTSFLSRKTNKLIGVHCTHGVNRTGLLVCTFLVEHCKFSANEAMEAFKLARGYPIERENYKQSIQRRYSVKRIQSTDVVSLMTPRTASNNWRLSPNFRLDQTDKTPYVPRPAAPTNSLPPEMIWRNFTISELHEAEKQTQVSENGILVDQCKIYHNKYVYLQNICQILQIWRKKVNVWTNLS